MWVQGTTHYQDEPGNLRGEDELNQTWLALCSHNTNLESIYRGRGLVALATFHDECESSVLCSSSSGNRRKRSSPTLARHIVVRVLMMAGYD